MDEEALALSRFKDFVASIDYTEDHYALAAKLGEAKGLWGEAALSLACVRGAARQSRNNLTPVHSDLLDRLGLVEKIKRRI